MASKLGLLEPAKKFHVRSCPHVSRCLSTSHYHLINIAALSIREEYVVVRHREALLEPEAFVPCGSWDIDVFLAHEVPLPHFSIPVHDFHFFWSLGPPRLSLRPSLHVVAETGAPRAAALTGCTAGSGAGRASCVRSACCVLPLRVLGVVALRAGEIPLLSLVVTGAALKRWRNSLSQNGYI